MKTSATANISCGERRSENAEGRKMSKGQILTLELQCQVCKEVRDISLRDLNSLFLSGVRCNCGLRLDPKRDLVVNDEHEKNKND